MSKRRSKRACHFPTCTKLMGLMHLFCWDHWDLLPYSMRDKLEETQRKHGRHIAVDEEVPIAISYLKRLQEKKEAVQAEQAE